MKKITLLILFTLISMVTHAQVFLSEDFGDATSLAQWNRFNERGNYRWEHSTIDNGTTGAQGALFLAGDNVLPGTGPYRKWLISPEMDLTNAVRPEISFEAKTFLANNQGDKLKIYASIFGPDDISGFVQIAEFSEFTQNAINPVSPNQNDWGLNHVDLSAFGGEFSVTIAFVVESTGIGFIENIHYGDNWLLDNIKVAEKCFPVTNLAVNAYSHSYISVTWQGTATSYDVEIVPANQNFTGIPTISTNTNTARLSGLVQNTEYKIRVRSNCGTVVSTWELITIRTTTSYCNQMFYDSGGPTGNYNNNDSGVYTMCPDNAGDVIQVIFNEFNTQANSDVLFVYKGTVVDETKIIGMYSGTTLPPTLLGTLANGGCLTFRFTSNATVVASGWAALVNCVPGPACSTPENVSLVSTTGTTATFTWSPGYQETAWEVVAQPFGTANLANAIVIPATTNPVTVTNLQPNTDYEFYVRAVCDNNTKSNWSNLIRFQTTQVLATLPYVENFDGVNPFFGFVNGTLVNKWVIGTAVSNSATRSLYISNDNGTTNAYTVTSAAVAHAYRDFQVPAGTLQTKIKFDWKAQGQTTLDYLRVWLVPTNYMPIAGTQIDPNIGAVQVGTMFNLNGTWKTENYDVNVRQFAGNSSRLVFEWVNNASTGTQPPAAIDNIEVSVVTCPKPTELSANNILANSANLTWVGNGVETAWEYYIVPTGQPAPTATSQGVSSLNRLENLVNNLQPNTSYTFYARAVCSSTNKSEWSVPFTFVTTQNPASLPYTENFDGDTVLMGYDSETQVNKWIVGTATFNSAGKSMYISNNNSANAYTVTSASISHFYRDIAIPAGAQFGNLRFDWKAQGQADQDYIKVWLVPTTYRPAAGTLILPGEGKIAVGNMYNLSGNWVFADQDVNLTSFAGQTLRLVFEWVNNTTTGTQPPGAIDNIRFILDQCPRPTNINLVSSNSNQVTIRWTNGNTETAWEYYLVPQGQPAPSDTTTGIRVTTNPTTITGLTADSSYTVYVRAICGENSSSFWSLPFNFNTTQNLATLPYFENFDGDNPVFSVNNGTLVNKWVLGTATFNSAGKSMYISNNNGTANAYTVTSAGVTHFYRDFSIPAGTNIANLKFDWKGQGEGNFDFVKVWLVPTSFVLPVGTEITAGDGRMQVGNTYNQSTVWKSEEFDLNISRFAGSNMRLVFQWTNDGSVGTQPPGAIDNIGLRIVECPKPTNISLENVFQDSASLTWFNGANETQWEYYIVPAGQPAPTPQSTGILTTNNPLLVTGLTPGTSYDFYVRAVCSTTSVSDWSNVFNFYTLQIPATLPYLENFDGTSAPITAINGNQINKWYLGTATFNSPGKSMYISNDNGVSNAYTVNTTSVTHFYRDIIIPQGAALGNLQFDFKAVGETSPDYIRAWIVPTTYAITPGTQINAAADRVQIGGNYNQSATWKHVNQDFNLVPFAGTTARVVFEWRNDGSVGTQPPGAVDNIELSVVTCPRPTNVLLTSVTSDTAVIRWTAGNAETQWEYIVLPVEDPAPTNATRGNVTTTNPLTITGLNPGLNYVVYIRAICSQNDISVWSNPLTFATTQIPAQLPYVENFDGNATVVGISNGTMPNKWHLGSATFSSPNRSMYISNDNGVSNVYTINTASVTHFYRDLAIPANRTLANLKFDWKGFGESTLDYIKVWLVPTTYTLTPGTLITAAADRIQLGGIYNQSADWRNVDMDVNITNFAGTTTRLVFEWRNDTSVGTMPAGAIDNINFSIITCKIPTLLTVTNTTQTSATIAWTANNGETAWEYYLVPAGDPAPDHFNTTGTPITTNPFTINGLTPGGLYDVYVRAVCGVNDSSFWSTLTQINTPQIPAPLPYEENFDGANVTIGVNNGTQVNKWHLGTATFNTPNKAMYISNDNGRTNAYTLTTASTTHFYRDLIIPAQTNLLNVQFDWKGQGQTTLDYIKAWLVPADYVLTPGTAITAAANRIQIGGLYNQQSTWQRVNTDVAGTAFAGTNARLVFEWVNNNTTGTQPPGAIDNVEVSVVTCPRPTALALPNVTSNSATISWVNGGNETSWEYFIVRTGEPAPASSVRGTVITTNPLTIQNLSPGTRYTVYVRAICSVTDASQWSLPLNFVTPQIPAELPYEDNFNTDSQIQFTDANQVNKWMIGTQAFVSAPTGLYISDNNFANNYTGTASTVHAYRDINLPLGRSEVYVEFDWKANGESTLDYLQVFLVPRTFTPVAGTLVTAANSGGILLTEPRLNLNNSWTHFETELDLTNFVQNARIIFQWRNDGSVNNQTPAAVDNLKIYAQACPRPTNLAYSVPSGSNTVTLTWTPTGTEQAWEVLIVPNGQVPNANSTGVVVGNPRYVFEAQNSTMYDYYVRALCSTTSTSNWAGPTAFTIFTPPGCASIDVVGVDVNLVNNQVYICPEDDTNDVTLQANYFGIGSTTSYEVSSIEYNPPFPSRGGSLIPITTDDQYTPTFNLPFNFCFFGNSYNSCRIADNGYIVFGQPYSAVQTNAPYAMNGVQIPNPNFVVKNAIYGVFQDTNVINNPAPNTQINYQVLGEYPCRALVVNFNEVPNYGTLCSDPQYRLTTQMVLYEISNIIEIFVDKRNPCLGWEDGDGVIGIQNAAGTQAYTPPGRNTGAWSANREAWRFTPNGPSDVTITWSQNGVVIGNGETVTLPVSEDTSVLATATYQTCDGSTVVKESLIDVVVTREMPTLVPNTLYVCEGSNVYDLTVNEDHVLSESNPLHYNVYFYTSEALAIANDPTTAILDPENFVGQQGQTIWMNVISLGGCSITKQFQLGESRPIPVFTLQGNTTVCNPDTSIITVVPTNITLDEALIAVTDPNGGVHTQSSAQVTLPINGLSGTYTFTVTKGCVGTATLNFVANNPAPTPTLNVTQPTCTLETGAIEILSPLGNVNGVRYTDLFISEVTDHETGGTSYIEIFNPTPNAINLADYRLQVNTNSSSCTSPIIGTIAPNTTFILAIGFDTPRGGIVPNYTTNCQGVNDNDQIVLTKADGTRVDVWGYDTRITFTPTSAGYVYRRLNTVNAPSTVFTPSDWSTLSSSNYSDVGTYIPGVSSASSYQYSIDGGITFQSDVNYTNLVPGTYVVIVREDGNSCLSESVEVTILPSTPLPVFNLTGNTTVCEGTTTIITVNADNFDAATAVYTITAPDGSTHTSPTNQVSLPINGLAGTYTITVGETCTDFRTIDIIVIDTPDMPTADVVQPTCTVGVGSITITNGNANQEYSIDGGVTYVTSSQFENLSPGIYNVVTRIIGNECTSDVLVVEIVAVPGTPVFTLSGTTLVCNTDTTVITVTPTNFDATAVTYEVTDPTGTVHTFNSPEIVLPINGLAGDYIITVLNTCVASQTVTIEINNSPDMPTADVVQPTCTVGVGSITITNGNANQEYSIDGGVTYVTSTQFENLVPGTYNVITRQIGYECLSDVLVVEIVALPGTPVFTLSGNTLVCNTDTTVITVTPTNFDATAVTYEVTDPTGTVHTFNSPEIVLPINGLAGDYIITVLNTCVASQTVTIEINNSPVVPIVDVDQTSCLLDTGVITIMNGDTSLEYSVDGGVTFQPSEVFEELVPGTYQVVTRYIGQNCLSEILSITINPLPSVNGVTVSGDCVNSSYTLSSDQVNANYTYAWYNESGNVLGTDATLVITQSGTYTLTVFYDAECSSTTTYNVENASCSRFIPKGISPNGDGLNDAFDISGLRAQSVKIYNRHGREVYSHGAGYTNQWYGQTKEGNDLPDATYYYVIKAGNGELFTGWVYISREVR